MTTMASSTPVTAPGAYAQAGTDAMVGTQDLNHNANGSFEATLTAVDTV